MGDIDESVDQNDSRGPPQETGASEGRLASVDPRIVKVVVKLLLGVGSLVALLALVSVLPGLDRLIPATPITFSDLIVALFTLGIVGVLVYGAPQIETLVRQEFDWPTSLVANVGAAAKYLIVLLAVFVAHWGLARAVLPFARDADAVWIYDATFLFLAVVPTSLVTLHVYRALDPAAALLTGKITADADQAVDVDREPTADATADRSTATGLAAEPGAEPSSSFSGVRSLRALRGHGLFGDSVLPSVGPERDGAGVLTKEEEILRILRDHDGRIEQTELVGITGWSKSTVSRVLTEMAEAGRVAKIDLGQGNLIALPGEEPETGTGEGGDGAAERPAREGGDSTAERPAHEGGDSTTDRPAREDR